MSFSVINHYLSVAVKLLVVGFLSSSTETKTVLISSWEEKEFRIKLLFH